MNESIRVREGLEIPKWEIWFTASRSGGPGGQHVNTTSSRVTLHWDISKTSALSTSQKTLVMRRLANRIDSEGVLQLSVDTERSQHRNKDIAMDRLSALIENALIVRKKRIPTRVSKGAKKRRLEAKKKRSAIKNQRGRVTEE